MKISEFRALLDAHPSAELQFVLPDDDLVEAHAHITEVGRVDKTFFDCGGRKHRESACLLQAWVADDTDHRLAPGKLSKIIGDAAPLFDGEDLPVEIEYEDCNLSQFPVLDTASGDGRLTFRLGEKHADCLAKDVCLPTAPSADACCSDGGCC